MTDYNYAALRTLGGAIDYTVRRYGRPIDVNSRDWEILASMLHVPQNASPVIELTQSGFVLEVAGIRMMYTHHDDNGKRLVEVQNNFNVPHAVS